LKDLIDQVLSDREDQKKQREKIDKIERDLNTVKELVCDASGNCRLVEKTDLETMSRQPERVRTKITPEFEEEWKGLSPDEKARRSLIPRDAHKTMLKVITDSPESRKGLNRDVVKRLTGDEWSEIFKEIPEVLEMVAQGICRSPEECREKYNAAIDKAKSGVKGEKSWLEK